MNHVCRGTGTRARKGGVDSLAEQKLARLVEDLKVYKKEKGVAPAMGKDIAFLFAWNKYHIRTPTVQRMYDTLNVSYHVIATHECTYMSDVEPATCPPRQHVCTNTLDLIRAHSR